MSVRYCGNDKRGQSVGKAKRNITFQNTFASTETQWHVKPLRMIDEVCFEMANIKQTRLAEHEGLKLMRFLRFALRKTGAFLSRKITLQSK